MDIERLLFGVIAILVIVVFVALLTYWELCNERRTSALWLRTSETVAKQRDDAYFETISLRRRLSELEEPSKD